MAGEDEPSVYDLSVRVDGVGGPLLPRPRPVVVVVVHVVAADTRSGYVARGT